MADFLNSLITLLPAKSRPIAKALVPVAAAFIVAVVSAIETGVELRQALILGIGAIVALGVHQTPNVEPHADIEELT